MLIYESNKEQYTPYVQISHANVMLTFCESKHLNVTGTDGKIAQIISS